MNVILISCRYTKYTPWIIIYLKVNRLNRSIKSKTKQNVSPPFDVIWRNIYMSLVIAMSKPLSKSYIETFFFLSVMHPSTVFRMTIRLANRMFVFCISLFRLNDQALVKNFKKLQFQVANVSFRNANPLLLHS